jgi:hypothetical protein
VLKEGSVDEMLAKDQTLEEMFIDITGGETVD